MERTHFLYKITCLINQKIYIGQTVEPTKRWNQHRRESANPTPSMVIGQAIKKYGSHNFEFEIIATCLGQNNANELETLLVSQYESHISTDKGYNVSYGGWNAPKSDAWKQAMKKWRESLTDEEKDAINEKHRQATIKFIAEQGHPSLGKKWSDESRAQLSVSLKALDKDLIYTPEVRKNMSEAHIGHKDTEETKEKKSLAQQERWEKLNKERELKEDIRCFAPGCDIVGTGNKYKFIDGIRYCNKHGLRILRYNYLELPPKTSHNKGKKTSEEVLIKLRGRVPVNKIEFTLEQINIILDTSRSIKSLSREFGYTEKVIKRVRVENSNK